MPFTMQKYEICSHLSFK